MLTIVILPGSLLSARGAAYLARTLNSMVVMLTLYSRQDWRTPSFLTSRTLPCSLVTRSPSAHGCGEIFLATTGPMKQYCIFRNPNYVKTHIQVNNCLTQLARHSNKTNNAGNGSWGPINCQTNDYHTNSKFVVWLMYY